MSRRLLIATAPIGFSTLDPQKKALTRSSVEDAVRRVTRDLEDMSRRYVRDGWVAADVTWDLGGAEHDVVVGHMEVSRPS